MKITFPRDVAKRIRALENIPNRTPQQEARLRKLYQTYSVGNTTYTPPHSYPTENTRVPAPSRDINKVIDYEHLIRTSPAIQAAFPKGPLEMQRSYIKRVTQELQARKQNLDLVGQSAVYNPNPTQPFFAQRKLNPDQKVFTTLDIETDDYSRPISISASRLQWDPHQKKFVAVDSYQRFYLASDADLAGTFAVHGMTSSKLRQLRQQQSARYSSQYNYDEMEELKQYIGSSTIVGHNIVGFDLNRLFPDAPIRNATIDTLLAARSTWKDDKNALDDVFYRLFGKTMEQAGLPHHDPNADTIASAMILQRMAVDKGYTGHALRYAMKSANPVHIAEYDSTMSSMITKGTYWDMFRGNDLYEVFMEEKDTGLVDVNGKPIGDPSDFAGRIYSGPTSLDEKVNLQQMQESLNAVADVVKRLAGGGVGGSEKMSSDLFQAYNQFNNYKRLGLVQRIASAHSSEEIETIMDAAGYETRGDLYDTITGMGLRLKEVKDRDMKAIKDAEFEEMKARKIARLDYHGKITESDKTILQATTSFDELEDAIDRVTTANKQYRDILLSIADIKPYDINQYISSKKGQWSGVMSASRGVVPGFLREPIGRLADAGFNVVDRTMAPWNAVSRTWNSGIGRAVIGAATAVSPVIGAGLGLGALGTQIYGNYKQANMEMAALNIQNNLNTLGAMISWVSTPFQLLHKATKLLIGSFSGLSLKLNSIMAGGISDMTQMGNPLEQLTGVSYLKYQGTTLMDLASLTGKGSTNTAIESMAKMQRDLYRFGRVDTNKLLAANMLGVFSEAFTPTTDAVGSYYGMANKILNNMQGQTASQQADTLYYASQLNETLAQTLRSALMMGVTDVRQLTNASAFNDMYWRPIGIDKYGNPNDEESRFRRTQFEYGAATQQFGYSKMRFADKLWNAIGRDLYNGLNRLVDSAAEGDWKGVLESASEMWEKFKTKAKSVWDELNDGKLEGKIEEGLSTAWGTIKEWAAKIGMGIIDVWNQIFRVILDKGQGLIAYLSTISLKPKFDWKNGLSFEFSSINSAEAQAGNKYIYNSESGEAQGGMAGYAALVESLYPNQKLAERNITKDQLRERLKHLPGVIKDGILDTPEINLPEYGIKGLNLGHNPELIEPLLDFLDKAGSEGTGFRAQAALVASGIPREYWDKSIFNQMGITSSYDTFTDALQEALVTSASIATGKSMTSKEPKVLFKFDFGGKEVSATYQQGRGVTISGVPMMQKVTMGNGYSFSVSQSD